MRAISITTTMSRTAVIVLSMVVVAGVAAYMYLVAQSIVNAALTKEVERDIASAATRIGTLEFSYLNTKEEIGTERAVALGFTAISEKYFVTRSVPGSLSLLSTGE